MKSTMSQDSFNLLRILADGQWHPFEETMAQLQEMVAPGRALRQWYTTRASETRVSAEPDEDEKIRSGSRTLAMSCVNSLKRRYLEFQLDEEGRRKAVRRRAETIPVKPRRMTLPPEEEAALKDGVAIMPGEEGAEAGEALAGAPGPSEGGCRCLSEQQIRNILADYADAVLRDIVRDETYEVVSGSLDVFQRGLQKYLAGRFHVIEAGLVDAGVAAQRGRQNGQQKNRDRR